MVEYLQVKIV